MPEPLDRVAEEMMEAVGPKMFRHMGSQLESLQNVIALNPADQEVTDVLGKDGNAHGTGGLSPGTSVWMVQRRLGVRLRCPGRLGGFECCPVRRIEAGTEGALEGQLITPCLPQPYDRKAKTHLEKRSEGCRLYGDYRRFLYPCPRCFESAFEKNGAET